MLPLLFSTPEHSTLAAAVRAATSMTVGIATRAFFPDGECHQRVETPVRGRDVVLIAAATDDASTARLFDLCCGFTSCGATSLTLVLPYFAYSTMDREASTGDVVTARTRALMLSSVTRPPGGLRLLLIEPHTHALPFYFAPWVRTEEIDVSSTIERLCRRVGGTDFTIASADAGRVKRVQQLAGRLGMPAAIAHKQRLGPDRSRVVAISGEVRGRSVVIYDDMVRSGSSLTGAARAYLDAGASRVAAVVTHAILPGDALHRLRVSGLIERLAATDTHPAATSLAGDYLLVDSVSPHVAASLSAPPSPGGTVPLAE